MKILSIGEILWDIIHGEQMLGGAPFNLAAHAVKLGDESWFLSAVGDDLLGRRAREEAERLGVRTRYLATTRQAETGIATVTLDSAGQPSFELLRPAAYDFLAPDDQLLADSFDAVCYGTLAQVFEPAHRATRRVLSTFTQAIHFYDVNLRPGHFNLPLVAELMSLATVVKLNDKEAAFIAGVAEPSLRDFCENQTRLFGLDAIAVTRGPDGCALLVRGEYAESPGVPVDVVDTVGAGDAFGSAFLHGFAAGWTAARIGAFANRVGALVAGRAGAIPDWTLEDVQSL